MINAYISNDKDSKLNNMKDIRIKLKSAPSSVKPYIHRNILSTELVKILVPIINSKSEESTNQIVDKMIDTYPIETLKNTKGILFGVIYNELNKLQMEYSNKHDIDYSNHIESNIETIKNVCKLIEDT